MRDKKYKEINAKEVFEAILPFVEGIAGVLKEYEVNDGMYLTAHVRGDGWANIFSSKFGSDYEDGNVEREGSTGVWTYYPRVMPIEIGAFGEQTDKEALPGDVIY